MKHLLAIITLVLWASAAAYASVASQADSAYMAEQYADAVELYTRSIAEEGATPDAYYNLGNAHWRNGDAGHAIINYERALRLDPSHADARINLDFVRTKIQDLPEDDSSFLGNLYDSITTWMSPDSWALTALLLFVAMTAMAAIYIFSADVAMRKTGFFGGIILLCFTTFAFVTAWRTAVAPYRHDRAVVIVPTTLLSSTPKASTGGSDKVVAIHEGTEVEIVDSVMAPSAEGSTKWYDVKINNSTRAWLQARDVEQI